MADSSLANAGPLLGGYLAALNSPVGSAGIYIHVPYCASRCTYCDFYSLGQSGGLSDAGADRYIAALRSQLAAVSAELPLLAETLYIGGGTPSLLGERIGEIVELVRTSLGFATGAEVTVEANPDDLSRGLLDRWRSAGVNRVSVGIQALDDAVLKDFGRRHTADEAVDALAMLGQSGMRWSADLIAGIPGVSDAMWLSWVQRLLDAGVEHVSIYPLTVEEGTVLASRVERGEYLDPDPDDAARQMVLAEQKLSLAGIQRYEIANYAAPAEESRHNMSYWTVVPYLGLGPSAASMLPTPDGGRVRFTLHDSLDDYLANPERGTGHLIGSVPAEVDVLSADETAREDVMLGLRTHIGVAPALVARASVGSVLEHLADEGLVERTNGAPGASWRLTERGWLLGNEVFVSVLFD